MRTISILFIFCILAGSSFEQIPKKVMKKMGPDPVLFLDSVEIDISRMRSLNPFEISNVNIVKPRKAKRIIGERGVDGAIYITTVKAAKDIYWHFLSSRSAEYRQLLNSPQADSIVQYILNGKRLSDSAAPGSLFLVNNKSFKHLEIIDKEQLLDYVKPKRYVILITAKRPRELLRKKAKE